METKGMAKDAKDEMWSGGGLVIEGDWWWEGVGRSGCVVVGVMHVGHALCSPPTPLTARTHSLTFSTV